ncbi:late secretory pathway protein avl9 [Tulasnella sp. 418]|nr:late secretory pathway protein avl9 [Tulasnella sp. 418]
MLTLGTSLRELIHNFRHRTLILLKLLILQKKVMFYGHPVERLCTFQYSLVSLIPNLFLAMEDAASPNLDRREHENMVPTELRTSDRSSLMRYMGLPLNVFGRDAFFQPYLPLQQVDMLKTKSWLCGTTNSIVTQQRDCLPDLLVNIETNTFEFNDPKVERMVALTAADRQWIDDLVRDVNDGWNDDDPSRSLTMQFKGSDDYLRAKFEDYISSALSSVKYGDFLLKASKGDVGLIGTGDENPIANFGDAWLTNFKLTNAYEHWNRNTDPALFDICEPRHPCDTRPTVISDIGLRLAEGIHDLKLAETVGPTRDAISQAISAGSTGFLKAFEGVRSEVAARMARTSSSNSATSSPPPTAKPNLSDSTGTLQAQQASLETSQPSPRNSRTEYPPMPQTPTGQSHASKGLKPLSLATSAKPGPSPGVVGGVDVSAAGQAAKAALSSWGSFIAKKAADIKRSSTMPAAPQSQAPATTDVTTTEAPAKTTSLRSPPLGFRGGLWTLGERAGSSSEPEKSNDPGTKSTG